MTVPSPRFVGLSSIVLCAVLCANCTKAAAQKAAPPGPQPIHGYVHARINRDAHVAAGAIGPGATVAVPDIEVAAKNAVTGALSPLVRTDPYGYFRTPALAPGTYNICVSGTGYAGGCDPQVISIADRPHVMDHIVIINTKQHAVVGTVLLADKKTPCFWYSPTFDANFVMTAKVTLVDSGAAVVSGPVRSNNLGEYVMTTEAAPGAYRVAVECEAIHAASAVSLTAGSIERSFVLSNHPPTADLLEAAKGGVGVRRASPGEALTITVPTADADHDTLHYRWLDESGGTPSLPDAATVNWSAPALTGPRTLRVLVSDGRGGYATGHTILNIGPNEMRFNGTAFNRVTHAPVAAASVNLNGVTTTTDASGRFEVKVPETTRFVLNVAKPGFALTSRIFYARATGIQVPLDPAQTGSVDGSTGGRVTIPVTGCRPSDNRAGGRGLTAVVTADCAKQEIGTLSFTFGPNSLMSGTTAFTGAATVEGFQFDLTLPNAIPGDQSATFKGADARLQTFGAFHVQPRDAAGNALQMAPGKSVDVSMPIHPLALASAPARIPFFSYDESSGLWVEHGELRRVGNTYVGKITHFSEFNADSTFGSSSCMKIQLDQGPGGFPSSVVLNATYVNPGVGSFNHPNTVVNDTVNPIVIERLVNDQDFNLQISDASNHVLQTVLLNSGPPVSVPFPVPYPYDGCKAAVVFNDTGIPPTSDHFLIQGTVVDTSADYQTQTTTGLYAGRDTFAHWLTANGFGGAETRAIYFNNGDLRFGRSMHCRNVQHSNIGFTADWIACYVSNFGTVGVDFNQQASNPLTDAYANTNVVATVAMEYHPEQTNKVQFWAFKGDNPVATAGDYFPNPALDVEGNKPMPQICMGCHQGVYGGTGQLVSGAAFLPFDVDSFIGDDGNPLQSTLGTGAQRPTQADLRQLNLYALQSTDNGFGQSTAYQSLMKLWYKDGTHPNGVTDAGATFHFNQGAAELNAINSGTFATHQSLYDNIVRPVCRACHIARSPGIDTWDQLSQLTGRAMSIRSLVCGPGNESPSHTMPHAYVPYKRFWEQSLNTTLGSELSVACPQ